MLMQIFNKMKDMVFILLVTGFFSWIANIININPPLASIAIGCFVLVVLASIGIFISMSSTSFPWCSGCRSWPWSCRCRDFRAANSS